jgi:PAS domain S-box-containing protein
MEKSNPLETNRDPLGYLAGAGEMAALMRSLDWSKTPLGPAESWSPTLKTTVRTLLVNRFPLLLWWGPHYIQLYNDAYRPIPGAKHPKAMGQPAQECWPEIWHIIGPLIDTPFRGGPASWVEDIFLEVNRHGFVEETHFTIAYSPVPDETAPASIGGVLGTVHEITEKVIGERRMVALRDLGSRPAEAKTAEEACLMAARTLEAHTKDVPFALLYLLDPDGKQARLAAVAGVPMGQTISPQVVELDADGSCPWLLTEVRRTETVQVVTDLKQRFDSVPPGPWAEPPREAVILPVQSTKAHEVAGFLVAGISARLRFDDAYRGFLDLAATQVATAIANARAYEVEKKRAEALAELDRAKTVFFSNVSHEFRTPLTLLLGPVEELLARSHTDLTPAAAGQLEVVNRNGTRLLRLVNTLLDFSRIEAGRVRATYQPTDLAAFTAELTSVFRAAAERAGLRLVADCPKLSGPVFVDREMWEKIVLNLLSNAFKFTFDGEIAVTLRQIGQTAQLSIRDTGTGIPAAEMPRLFERFHRVQNARGRTHEGSGIGLALVQELVKLHGGSIVAESKVGKGSTFTVTMPLGAAHLPAEQVGTERSFASSATGAKAYVEEALRWLPDELQGKRNLQPEVQKYHEPLPTTFVEPQKGESDDRPLVLVADDNADMRHYVARLLAERYRVDTVPDGELALVAVKNRQPDLILSDVMMPKLDGFSLLRRLRDDGNTRNIPVIMLSARAGEECRVDGMEAGADDYLVKPFSARELLARVSAHLQIARLRREATAAVEKERDWFRVTLTGIGDAVITTDSQGRISFMNGVAESLTGWTTREATGHPLDAVFRILNEMTRQGVENPATKALREGAVIALANHTVLISKEGTERPIDDSAAPVKDGQGNVIGCVLVFRDVTERRRLEKENAARLAAARLLASIVESSGDAIVSKSQDGIIQTWNAAAHLLFGYTAEQAVGKHISLIIPSDRAEEEDHIISRIRAGEPVDHFETVRLRSDGQPIHVSLTISPIKDEAGHVVGASKIARDITDRKQAEERIYGLLAELKDVDRRKDEFLAVLAHELRGPLAPLRNTLEIMKRADGNGDFLQKAHSTMERQLGQLVRLVDDLIDVSRITRNKLELRRDRVELASIIHQSVEACRPLAESASHQVSVTLTPEPIYLHADPVRLAQVFGNLLNNACKYTEPGGKISLTVERQGSDVVVTVKDNGLGIPPDKLASVFEMFTQIDRTLERSQGGLGIGLTLVKRLVELHGGTVTAHSRGPGKGSEFVVRLPILIEKPKHDVPRPAAAPPNTPHRILVVDDNRDSATSLALLLKFTGNETHTAHDGLEAVEAAERFRPDVVLLDIGLPKLNGYDACRRIREQLWGKHMLLVALTGWGQQEDHRRSKEVGFDRHMVKPVDLDALQAMLAALGDTSRK